MRGAFVICFGVAVRLVIVRRLGRNGPSVSDDEFWGPVEAMTVFMSLQQSIRTKLKEMASIFEAEVADDSFQGVQMFEADASCTFAFCLSTDCFFSIHVSVSCSSLTIEPVARRLRPS
jgi:hypothetical protein